MKIKWFISLTITAALLVGCGSLSDAHDNDQSLRENKTTTTDALVSRGVSKSPNPDWSVTPDEQIAVDFIRAASTPDTRLDQLPKDAWTRATDYTTKDFVPQPPEEDGNESKLGWWRRLKETDGFISVEITNIIGDQPQAAPDPNSPPPTDVAKLEVRFHRILNTADGKRTPDLKPRIWAVTIRDGKISDVRILRL